MAVVRPTYKIIFRLTLRMAVRFDCMSEKECTGMKLKCLKEGIEAEDGYGTKYFYPAKRIVGVEISKISYDR